MSIAGIHILTLSVIASGTLAPYRAVTALGAYSATDIFGITTADAIANECVGVSNIGTSGIESGAAIPLGTKYVIADAQGRAIPGGTASACLGKLIAGQSATAAGQPVLILLQLTI